MVAKFAGRRRGGRLVCPEKSGTIVPQEGLLKFLPVLPAIACVALLAPSAAATDRYYRDSYGVSPSGRFRVDAKSPDNAGERPQPFAAGFTYTLTDTTTKKTVWARKQPMTRAKGDSSAHSSEGSPMAVFVNDDGIVAARLARDTLLFLDPADGHKRGEAEVLKVFPKAQHDQFVSHTTAGPKWSQESDWFFLSVPGADKQPAATYFVVRPFWNHRLVIDVATAKHVDLGSHANAASADALANAEASVKRLLTATIAEESRRAMAALTVTPEALANSKDYGVYWGLSTALHTIGFLKLTDAEAGLRSLEKIMGSGLEDVGELRSSVREAP